MKPIAHITDPRFVKAMAHPLRLRIIGALERRTASPSELAQELDAPLGNVSYHVRQLHGLGLLKLVKETPRRGAVEHYYRLETRPQITDKAWSKAPPMVKEAMLAGVLSQIAAQVNQGATMGGFDRSDSHLSRLPLTLDEEGFKEASREFGALVKRLKEIEDESRKRLAANEHVDEIGALAVLMLFEAKEDPLASDGHARSRKAAGRRRKAAAAD
jgi:DNA-binding transcriptional ArsR family regulator